MDELGSLLGGGGKVLLDENGGLGGNESLVVDLSALEEDGLTFRGLEVLGKDLAHLSDDGSGLLVLTNLLLEFFLLLFSVIVEVVEVLVVASELSLLGVHDALEHLTGGVQ